MTPIDWYRVAYPQQDGYDTKVVSDAAAQTYGFVPSTDLAPAPNWLGGRIRLANDIPAPGDGLIPAPFDHQSLQLAERYLQWWPECGEQLKALVKLIYIFDWPQGVGARGCFCGTPPRLGSREDTSLFGEVFSTVFDSVGFLEGVVHEMTHWKLHALGVHFEEWDDRLLLNRPEEVFESSLRKDKPRPMGAVLHAHWVCLHVLCVDMAAAASKCNGCPKGDDAEHIAAAVKRVKEGQATVGAGARWTPAGAELWRGIEDWTADLLSVAEE